MEDKAYLHDILRDGAARYSLRLVDLAGDLVAGIVLHQVVRWEAIVHLGADDGGDGTAGLVAPLDWEGQVWVWPRNPWVLFWGLCRVEAREAEYALARLERKHLLFYRRVDIDRIPRTLVRLNDAHLRYLWGAALEVNHA